MRKAYHHCIIDKDIYVSFYTFVEYLFKGYVSPIGVPLEDDDDIQADKGRPSDLTHSI